MKVSYFFIATLLFLSCTSSQKSTYIKEAQKKVQIIKPLIELTDEQVVKMIDIEAEFLKQSRALRYSSSYQTQKETIANSRLNKIRELLQRDQYVKFDVIENKRIKPTPIRVQ